MAGMTPCAGENKELSLSAGSAEEARLAFACRFPDGVGGSRLFLVPLGGIVDMVCEICSEKAEKKASFQKRKVVVSGQEACCGDKLNTGGRWGQRSKVGISL